MRAVPSVAPLTSSAASGRCCWFASSRRGRAASASSNARSTGSPREPFRCACGRSRSRAIVERRTFAEVPPRVEYALTEKGLALVPIIDVMRSYGEEWLGAPAALLA